MSDEIISQEEAKAIRDALLNIEECLRYEAEGMDITRERRIKLRAIKYFVERALQRAIEVDQ